MFHRCTCSVLTGFCLFGLITASGRSEKATEVELKVGVVQRFGENPTARLSLQATQGDILTLSFIGAERKPQTLQTNFIKIEISQQPLPTPIVEERLVLGNYRSFETAEHTAENLQTKGIPVEVAQPNRWQVWAKRDVYKTPLLRRLLLQSLQTQGADAGYVDTKIVSQQPRLSLVANGLRYNLDRLEVRGGKGLIAVRKEESDRARDLYPGVLQVQPNAYGSYTLVNQVPIETYLRGVVSHEIDAEAPYAAKEAQAILARTYALRNLRRFAVDNYQLCADQQCQVYKGLAEVDPASDRAIAASSGKVLTYQNRLIDALYSSTSGGVTAPFEDVWNGSRRPYLQAVVDSTAQVWDLSQQPLSFEENFRRFINMKEGFNEKGWTTFRWRRETSLEQITQDLRRYVRNTNHPFGDFEAIAQIQILERSPSGRIIRLAVQTNKGVLELYKDDIRSAFIAPLSTLFYLEPVYETNNTLRAYAFVGGGFGHGVGLSQTGAYNLAEQGWTGEQIINFYFRGTQIQPINQSIVLHKNLPRGISEQRFNN